MSSQPKMSFKQGSKVWVWDSIWLPAVIVRRAQMGHILVRLEHGVTFPSIMANLRPRDPACQHAPSIRQGVRPNMAVALATPTGASILYRTDNPPASSNRSGGKNGRTPTPESQAPLDSQRVTVKSGRLCGPAQPN